MDEEVKEIQNRLREVEYKAAFAEKGFNRLEKWAFGDAGSLGVVDKLESINSKLLVLEKTTTDLTKAISEDREDREFSRRYFRNWLLTIVGIVLTSVIANYIIQILN